MFNKARLAGAILGGTVLFGASAASADITMTYPGLSCVHLMKTPATTAIWYQGTEAQNFGADGNIFACPVPQEAGRIMGATVTGHNFHPNGVRCWVTSNDAFSDSGFTSGSVTSSATPHYTITLPAVPMIHVNGATYVGCLLPRGPGSPPQNASIATYIVIEDT